MKPLHTIRSHYEPHSMDTKEHLNWLRAAVLGANDGITSVAGLVLGVAGATTHSGVIFAAGLAGLIAGSISMASGEYVSVSSARDTEESLMNKERWELAHEPEKELQELAGIYERKGLKKSTALLVAQELTAHDVFTAHVEAELGMHPEETVNPWHAALASALSFLAGGVIPFIAIIVPPAPLRIPIAFLSVLVALVVTGVLSGSIGKGYVGKSVVRVVIGGVLAMVVTHVVGKIFGVTGV